MAGVHYKEGQNIFGECALWVEELLLLAPPLQMYFLHTKMC